MCRPYIVQYWIKSWEKLTISLIFYLLLIHWWWVFHENCIGFKGYLLFIEDNLLLQYSRISLSSSLGRFNCLGKLPSSSNIKGGVDNNCSFLTTSLSWIWSGSGIKEGFSCLCDLSDRGILYSLLPLQDNTVWITFCFVAKIFSKRWTASHPFHWFRTWEIMRSIILSFWYCEALRVGTPVARECHAPRSRALKSGDLKVNYQWSKIAKNWVSPWALCNKMEGFGIFFSFII